MRYLIEVDESSPFFTTKNEFDGSPEPPTIVAFTRGSSVGSDLIRDLQEASDNSPSFIDGDFQLARIIAECTSDDPNNHQGDTCPIHEEEHPHARFVRQLVTEGPAIGESRL